MGWWQVEDGRLVVNSSLRTKVPGYVTELIHGRDSPDDNIMKDSQVLSSQIIQLCTSLLGRGQLSHL